MLKVIRPFFIFFAGTEVINGSFNRTISEDCGGGTVNLKVLPRQLLSITYPFMYHLDLTTDEYRFLLVGATVTIATALVRLVTKLIQLCMQRLDYLQYYSNLLEIPLYLCSVIFTFVFATPCLCVYSWQWETGALAVFLGWIGLICFLQSWPVTGIYILMFRQIIQSFLKIAFLALLLVIAFALAFYMIFNEADEMVSILCIPEQSCQCLLLPVIINYHE